MLGLTTTDLCIKFEISTLTHYKNMKGAEKFKNLGVRVHQRSSATQAIDRVHTTSYSTLAFILYRFRVIASYLSKVADFNPPHLHLSPPFKFCCDLWRQKTRVTGLSCGIICIILGLAILIQCQIVTDRHTHRHTKMAYTVLTQCCTVKSLLLKFKDLLIHI